MIPSAAQILLLLVVILIAVVIPAYLFSSVIRKSGHNPWWVVLTFIPFVNILAIWVFAFAPWPAED